MAFLDRHFYCNSMAAPKELEFSSSTFRQTNIVQAHPKTVMKRARQNLFPLRRLKRFGMGPQILTRFYSCTIESIQTGCITAWYGNCSTFDRKALQRVV